MIDDINSPNNNPNKGKAMAGVILLAVGAVLLLQQFHFFFLPRSLELWPLWLVAWGLYVGSKHNFQKPSGSLLIGLGIILFVINNVDNSDRILWPVAVIGFGLWLILRKGKHSPRYDKNAPYDKGKFNFDTVNNPTVDYTVKDGDEVPPKEQYYSPYGHGDDFLDTVSVFGGVNKTVLSKNFKGGEIVNIFGGAELDFTQADIQGRVIIDITQIFGGTKIIVPSNWQVVSDLAAVFAGVDDKRIRSTASLNNDKILVLKGVSIFAGVDIRSY
jgi:predicted membrane protein